MSKTNKELAVDLMDNYLKAVYSQDKVKALDAAGIKDLLKVCYDAVKAIPDD